jgi:hypothetical protein
MKVKLGATAQDKATGFEGTVMGHARYLTGCDQYCLQPKVEKSGTLPAAEWFDEGRVKLVGEGLKKKDIKGNKNGCDMTPPKL